MHNRRPKRLPLGLMVAVRGIPSGMPGFPNGSVREPAYSCLLALRRGEQARQLHFSFGAPPCSNQHPIPPKPKALPPTNPPTQKKRHDAADRAQDHYLKPPANADKAHKPSTMFQVTPDQNNESLLAHACESLASANVMTSDIAAYVDSPQRHTILAIQPPFNS
jgi:hypothetical protein